MYHTQLCIHSLTGYCDQFGAAAGHNVAGVMLTTHSSNVLWLSDYVEFVNEDDPEKIRNAMTASSVSLIVVYITMTYKP